MSTSTFNSHWLGLEGIFGGYVLGRFAEAAMCIDGFLPISLTIQFVSAVHPGDAELRTDILHQGRKTASVRMELHQGDRLRSHAVAILVPEGQDVTWTRYRDLTGVPPPEDSPVYRPTIGALTYASHLEIKSIGTPTLAGGAAAWMRLSKDAAELVLGTSQAIASVFLDAMPPGLFTQPRKPVFVPTIDFTAHFSPALVNAADDWFYAINETVWTNDVFCVEESTLCRPDGLIVAQVRQTRTIRWPDD